MKKLFFIIALMLPMGVFAQNEWETPDAGQAEPKVEKVKKVKKVKTVDAEDAKYLAGAVPEVDGRVVFTLDVDAKGKSAQEIYDIVYAELEKLTKTSNQFEDSRIAIVNKKEHVIAARYKEWLVFNQSFISLDRTEFNYTLIARCSDGHLTLTMERMSYNYEADRDGGFKVAADEWITDKYALNKKKTKLSKVSGKFRRKTIDRKDYIFGVMANALK